MKRNKQLNKRQNTTSKRGYAKCWNTQMFIWNMPGGVGGGIFNSEKKELIVRQFHTSLFQRANLIQTLWLSHGALEVESSYILPVLLQKRNQEVDSKVNICYKLILSHFNVANSHSKAQNLKGLTKTSQLVTHQADLPAHFELNRDRKNMNYGELQSRYCARNAFESALKTGWNSSEFFPIHLQSCV